MIDRPNDWKLFLTVCRRVLGNGNIVSRYSQSWCAWTTFSSFKSDVTYWKGGIPDDTELLESCTSDGGLWRQSFYHSDLAHVIIPAVFSWETFENGQYWEGLKTQDIDTLSFELSKASILHRKTDLMLEVKAYQLKKTK